jgi:hypothetical protein
MNTRVRISRKVCYKHQLFVTYRGIPRQVPCLRIPVYMESDAPISYVQHCMVAVSSFELLSSSTVRSVTPLFIYVHLLGWFVFFG